MNFLQGCALSGSTQSDKAETVKGFASILGKYLYTFNGGKSFDQCALVNVLKVEQIPLLIYTKFNTYNGNSPFQTRDQIPPGKIRKPLTDQL